KPPKYIILSIDPYVVPGDTIDNANFILKTDFVRYAFMPAANNAPIVNYFHFNVFEKYLPLFAILKYDHLSDYVFIQKNVYTMYGYDRHGEAADLIYSDSLVGKKLIFPMESKVEETKAALDQLKSFCAEHQIKLLCIQTPVYKPIYNEAI